MQPKVHQGILTATGFRFAIVAARWNDFLTSKLIEGALDALERLGASEEAVESQALRATIDGASRFGASGVECGV